MPPFYVKYADKLEPFTKEFAHVLPPIAVDPSDLAHSAMTPGQRVLALHPGANFQNLFNSFLHVFTD